MVGNDASFICILSSTLGYICMCVYSNKTIFEMLKWDENI